MLSSSPSIDFQLGVFKKLMGDYKVEPRLKPVAKVVQNKYVHVDFPGISLFCAKERELLSCLSSGSDWFSKIYLLSASSFLSFPRSPHKFTSVHSFPWWVCSKGSSAVDTGDLVAGEVQQAASTGVLVCPPDVCNLMCEIMQIIATSYSGTECPGRLQWRPTLTERQPACPLPK